MNELSYDEIERSALSRWDHIAHPLGSLGVLETDIARLCAMQRSAVPDISRRAAVIFCADHGVVREGVTQTGQKVTRVLADKFAAGQGMVNILARRAGADVYTIDIGMNCPVYPAKQIQTDAVIDRKTAMGTADLYLEDAMTREELNRAISEGVELCRHLKEDGYDIITCGEMGIGNTTSAAIITGALLDLPAEKVTGRGAGLSDEKLSKKLHIVRSVLACLGHNASPVDILRRAGGFELAGMTGLHLGASKYHMPVIIDGVTSCASALLAARIDPDSKKYMLASHRSSEAAAGYLLDELDLAAPISAGMHQGEGTGALMLLPLLDMAADVYRDMQSFDDMNIKRYQKNETG